MSAPAEKLEPSAPVRPHTPEEIAAATERARGEDGVVDPYELAALLARPRSAHIRSDNDRFRFGAGNA